MNRQQTNNELLKTFRKLGDRHSIFTVFEDFLAMLAIAISNGMDLRNYEKREDIYKQIVKKYEQKEVETLQNLGVLLIEEMELQGRRPKDILGPVFHELELHNKYRGQFFTAQNLSDMIAKITINAEMLKNTKYIKVAEPACGSGAMMLAVERAKHKPAKDSKSN